MTLLTKEEQDSHCYKISTSPLSPLRSGLDGTFNSGPFVRVDVRVDEMLKHQLRKAIEEVKAMQQKYIGRRFGQAIDDWLEAARKEIME